MEWNDKNENYFLQAELKMKILMPDLTLSSKFKKIIYIYQKYLYFY